MVAVGARRCGVHGRSVRAGRLVAVRGAAEGRFGYLVEDRLPGASRFNI